MKNKFFTSLLIIVALNILFIATEVSAPTRSEETLDTVNQNIFTKITLPAKEYSTESAYCNLDLEPNIHTIVSSPIFVEPPTEIESAPEETKNSTEQLKHFVSIMEEELILVEEETQQKEPEIKKKKKTPTKIINETKTVIKTDVATSTETVTEEPTKSPDKNIYNFSEDEIWLLAAIICAEAESADRAEMARVGQVVLNRITSKYWEVFSINSIYDVLTQKNQYPTTYRRIQNGLQPTQTTLEVARGLVNGTIDAGLPKNVIWQTRSAPTWKSYVYYQSQWHYYSAYIE